MKCVLIFREVEEPGGMVPEQTVRGKVFVEYVATVGANRILMMSAGTLTHSENVARGHT